MRFAAAYITVCLALALCAAAIAADGAPPPPAPPAGVGAPAPPPGPGGPPRMAPSGAPGAPGMPGGTERRVRSVPVGPADAAGPPRRVRGQVLVTAVLPTGAKIVSVELFCNSTLLGQKSQAPYQVEFNSETVTNGPQTLKAVGLDADGKQVWTAITKIDVQNAAPGARGTVPPNGPIQAPKPIGSNPNSTAPPVDSPRSNAPVASNASSLVNSYSSAKLGFTVRYPAGWTAKDMTAEMKPRKAGGAWVQFVPGKAAAAGLIINVRRVRLSTGTDADVFAKFNPYVSSWERKTVLGSSAFATTSSVAPKQVIHRLIVIKDGYAWMLNCIDKAGTAGESGRVLFESVVQSLTPAPAPSKGVSVREIKKP